MTWPLYFLVFAIAWSKLDFWWAVAVCATVNILAPWHPSHFRRTPNESEEP